MVALAVFFAVFIAFVVGFLYFWGNNPGEVTVFLTSDFSLTQPIPIMIIGAVVVGLIAGYGFHLFSLMSHGLYHWRATRRERKGREIVSLYREGVGRLLSGDLKKAHSLLERALDRDPGHIETCLAMANVHIQEGNPQEGVSLLIKAKQRAPKSLEILFKLAATYEEMGRDEESIKAYQDILDIEADNRKALRSLRDIYLRHNRWQDALELQRRILKVGPGPKRLEEEKKKLLSLRYEVARLALEADKVDEAKAAFKEITKEAPDFVPARVSLGDAYAAQDRPEDAAKTWQEGYQALGKSTFLSRLEDLYLEEEDPSSLLSFYRSAIIDRADDLMLRLFYGKLCLRLEMVDEALEQLFTVESSGVELPQLHLLLAEAHRRRNRIDDAIREYKKALGVNSQLRLGYVCDVCEETSATWQSRCPECGTWGSFSLSGRQSIQNAKPLAIREIHHGEREAWNEEE